MIVSFDEKLNVISIGQTASSDYFCQIEDEVGISFLNDPKLVTAFKGIRDPDGTVRMVKLETPVINSKNAFNQFAFVEFSKVEWSRSVVLQVDTTELRLVKPSPEFELSSLNIIVCLDGDPDEYVNSYTISDAACPHNLLEFYPYRRLSFFGPALTSRYQFCWTLSNEALPHI